MTMQDVGRARDALGDLLQAPGERFVRQAYELILGRPADSGGEAHYQAQLKQGRPREAVLLEIARSAEGVRKLASLPALAKALSERCGEGHGTAVTLDSLLALSDVEFVHAAVQALLHLPADDAQVLTLCGRLRAGTPRLEMLRALAQAGGTSGPTGIPGLDERLAALSSGRPAPATHVDELLALQGRWFVEAAYQSVLGRAADAAGALVVLELLARGRSRAGILRRLALSEEAARNPPRLAGLPALIARHRLHNVPGLAWFFGFMPGSLSESAVACWMRRRDDRRRAFWAMSFATPAEPAVTAAAPAASPAALEAALLARQEAMAAVQRDNFEREFAALRAERGARPPRRRLAGRTPGHRRPRPRMPG